MKNLNSMIAKGSANQRALIYFENLCIESIKEETKVSGFLSDVEKERLYRTFDNQSDRKTFNQFNKAYGKVITALDKLLILRLVFEVSVESYLWIKLCHIAQNSLLETINEKIFEDQEIVKKDSDEFREPIKDLFFGQLYRQNGLFEIEPNKELMIPQKLPLIKSANIEKLIKVKSGIHTIRAYMKGIGFKVIKLEELIGSVESETINLCYNGNIDYNEVQIDNQYASWFRSYFLED